MTDATNGHDLFHENVREMALIAWQMMTGKDKISVLRAYQLHPGVKLWLAEKFGQLPEYRCVADVPTEDAEVLLYLREHDPSIGQEDNAQENAQELKRVFGGLGIEGLTAWAAAAKVVH